MSLGKTMLGRRHVLPSVTSTLAELQVEGTFPTGTYLVTVHYPISSDDGDLEKALYGSFLPIPPADAFPDPDPEDYLPEKMPGAVVPVKSLGVTLSEGRRRIKLKVMSKGDRPIQVFIFPLWLLVVETDESTRLGRITILSKPTLNCTSTVLEPMATDSISPPVRPSVSSQEIPRRFRLWKLGGTESSAAATFSPLVRLT